MPFGRHVWDNFCPTHSISNKPELPVVSVIWSFSRMLQRMEQTPRSRPMNYQQVYLFEIHCFEKLVYIFGGPPTEINVKCPGPAAAGGNHHPVMVPEMLNQGLWITQPQTVHTKNQRFASTFIRCTCTLSYCFISYSMAADLDWVIQRAKNSRFTCKLSAFYDRKANKWYCSRRDKFFLLFFAGNKPGLFLTKGDMVWNVAEKLLPSQ